MPQAREARAWFIVLSDRAAVGWVVSSGKMGFVASRKREVSRLREGDTAFLYATKGTLGSEGMLFAEVRATSSVRVVPEPYKVASRDVELETDLSVVGLAELGTGLPIVSLVSELKLFAPYKQPSSWRGLLQRPLVSLYGDDEDIVRRALAPLLREPTADAVGSYAT
jgi:hypothetical protein